MLLCTRGTDNSSADRSGQQQQASGNCCSPATHAAISDSAADVPGPTPCSAATAAAGAAGDLTAAAAVCCTRTAADCTTAADWAANQCAGKVYCYKSEDVPLVEFLYVVFARMPMQWDLVTVTQVFLLFAQVTSSFESFLSCFVCWLYQNLPGKVNSKVDCWVWDARCTDRNCFFF